MRGASTNDTGSDYAKDSDYGLYGYERDNANRIDSNDIDGNKNEARQRNGLLVCLIVGDSWVSRSSCGSWSGRVRAVG